MKREYSCLLKKHTCKAANLSIVLYVSFALRCNLSSLLICRRGQIAGNVVVNTSCLIISF